MAARRRPQARRVGAGAGLGQAVAREVPHRDRAGRSARAAAHRRAVDHPGDHVVDRQIGRRRGAARRQRLEEERRLSRPRPAPPDASET